MSRMRVLWFTGVQLPALTGQGLTRAGWQEGLRQALETNQPEVELGIAAFGPEPRQPLIQGNATYYTIPRRPPSGPLAKAWAAWQHSSYSEEDYDRCLELTRNFAPDLVHFHGSENFFGLISERLSVPSVLSLQALVNGYRPFVLSDLGWRAILKQLGTKEFLKGEGVLHKWMSWNRYYRTEQKILHACRNYIGRTAWDKAVLLAINPQANYFHCDEVLADPFYSLEWQGAAAGDEIIYSTSSDAFIKGGLILAQALVILEARGWKNVNLHLAGLHPGSALGRRVAALAAQNNLEKRIKFLGRLSPQQITQEMRCASVYVLPSHIDNSPNSLCEAMLMGMPCIAAAVGGVPSLIRDGTDGLLYHDRDAYMLADTIIRILKDPPFSARLGAQARRTALERHDRKKIAGQTVRIYKQLLSSQA